MTTHAFAPLTFAVPLIVAALLRAAPTAIPRRVADVAAVVAAAVSALLATALAWASTEAPIVHWVGGWRPQGGSVVGIPLVADPLASGLIALAGVLTAAVLIFSWRYYRTVGTLYHTLTLVFLGGFAGFVMAADLFTMFVFLELMSIAAYALTGFKIEADVPLTGALNFAVTNTIGAVLFLVGGTMIYARAGTPNIAEAGQRLAGAGTDELVVVAFALIMTGLFVKAALLPFHFWHADSHAVAPTPICVLFGCVLIEVGIFAAARVHVGVFAEVLGADTGALQAVLLTVGLVTGAVTAVMCVLQSHLKRLLAFSSIAHVGIVTAGWGLLTSAGLAGAAVYVAGHGFVKAALFLLVGILLHHLDSVDEAQLHGRARGSPAAGGLFVAGGLALAGMPPFGMFTGKALIDSAGKDAGVAWLGTAVLAIAAVTGAAVVRAGLRIYAGVGAPAPRDPDRPDESEDYVDHAPARTPRTMIVTAAVLMIAGAATGAPQLVTAAEHAAGLFVDADVQAAAVLGGDQAGTPSVDRTSAWSADSVIEGMLAAAVALGLGIVTARRAGAPGAWGTESASPYSPVRWLRLMHSGRITDYVVWLCIGCAVLVSTSLLALR